MSLAKTEVILCIIFGCFVASALSDASVTALRKSGAAGTIDKIEKANVTWQRPEEMVETFTNTVAPNSVSVEEEDISDIVRNVEQIEASLQAAGQLIGAFEGTQNMNGGAQKVMEEVRSNAAFYSPIPFPATGTCQAGATYNITGLHSLVEHGDDLECIFAAGLEPLNVPLGYGYGYVLSAANTGFWSPVLQPVYQGDYIVKTQCGGNFYKIGWLSVGGADVGTAVWTINKLGWEMADGEYPEGDKKSILMDFTVDVEKLCAPEGNESPLGLIGFSPFKNSLYPISTFKDIGRVVGTDTDGATIMLNKALANAPGLGAQTVLFYAIKTFDKSVRPPYFEWGQPVVVPVGPNGETTIKYRRAGIEGVISRAVTSLIYEK